MRTNHEEIHQISFFRFLEVAQKTIPELAYAFHPPNGGHRVKVTAARMKAMGTKPGVPDVIIPIPRNSYTGMVIEFKYGKNKLSIYQYHWMEMFETHGWRTEICYDWTHAASAVCEYFSVSAETFGLTEYSKIGNRNG